MRSNRWWSVRGSALLNFEPLLERWASYERRCAWQQQCFASASCGVYRCCGFHHIRRYQRCLLAGCMVATWVSMWNVVAVSSNVQVLLAAQGHIVACKTK